MNYLELLPANVHEEIAKRIYTEEPFDVKIEFEGLKIYSIVFFRETKCTKNIKDTIGELNIIDTQEEFKFINWKEKNSFKFYNGSIVLYCDYKKNNLLIFDGSKELYIVERLVLRKINITEAARNTIYDYVKDGIKCSICNKGIELLINQNDNSFSLNNALPLNKYCRSKKPEVPAKGSCENFLSSVHIQCLKTCDFCQCSICNKCYKQCEHCKKVYCKSNLGIFNNKELLICKSCIVQCFCCKKKLCKDKSEMTLYKFSYIKKKRYVCNDCMTECPNPECDKIVPDRFYFCDGCDKGFCQFCNKLRYNKVLKTKLCESCNHKECDVCGEQVPHDSTRMCQNCKSSQICDNCFVDCPSCVFELECTYNFCKGCVDINDGKFKRIRKINQIDNPETNNPKKSKI